LTVTGVDADLISYLVLSFKLRDCGEGEFPDVKVVDIASRRRTPRYDLEQPLPVFEQGSYRQLGELLDLSIEGLRMITNREVNKDDIICCRVKLPRTIFQQEYLSLDARCMWCRRGPDDGRYESGHRINRISTRDAAIVLHLLIHYAKKQSTTQKIKVVR
jgi:hypothetical protein